MNIEVKLNQFMYKYIYTYIIQYLHRISPSSVWVCRATPCSTRTTPYLPPPLSHYMPSHHDCTLQWATVHPGPGLH